MLSSSPQQLSGDTLRTLPAMVPVPRLKPVEADVPGGLSRQGDFLDEAGKRQLDDAGGTVEQITWRHSVYRDKTPSDVLQIRQLFMRLAPKGIDAVAECFNTMRRVHRLAWSVGYDGGYQPAIIHSPFLGVVLDLVRKHYCDGMLLGLFDALLRHWQTLALNNKEILAAFIDEKIKGYAERRICLRKINENIRYYTRRDGDVALGEMLHRTQTGLSKVWQFLGLPDHVTGYDYFSQVGFAYTDMVVREKRFNPGVPEIVSFLEIHQREDVIKKSLSKLILEIDRARDALLMEMLQASALRLIGDPADEARWYPWNEAADGEAAGFEKVRRLVGRGIIRRLIRYFFDSHLLDDTKKRFWLKYTDQILKMKIYCSEKVYERVAQDERMCSYMPTHFGSIRGAEGNEVALILKVKNHLLIESITERPAFFACQLPNARFPGIEAASIHLADLHRLHEMQPLLQRRGENVLKHKEEGKITDGGVRTSFLAWWLRHHLGV